MLHIELVTIHLTNKEYKVNLYFNCIDFILSPKTYKYVIKPSI